MSFAEYLDQKFKPLTQEEYDKLENKEKSLEEMNTERNSEKIRELCDIVEANHAGVKFKRMFEDMRKKLRVDEKIQADLGLKLDNTKLEEKNLKEDVKVKFNELGDADRKEKFRHIFKNSYHNIIISFFSMMINLKKIKQDFAIVFRFFGHDESDIEEFIYEYNCFCDCLHPRYCGDYGYNKVKFDVEKEKKDFKINTETQEFMAVGYRGDNEKNETTVFETMKNIDFERNDPEFGQKFDNFYAEKKIKKGYNEIYLNFIDKLTQNCTFCVLDDYTNYINSNNKDGKLLLIDPYDVDTLQIFFDTDLHKYPEKITVIDVVTKNKIPLEKCLNKYIVNVEPYRAIIDINYFNNKIQECVANRKNELLKMEGKEQIEVSPEENVNIEEEISKIPGDIYLKMTVLPLLHNALTMCEMVRPSDPIAFISNFMLINKGTTKKIDEVLKEIPKQEIENMDHELLFSAGDESRLEKQSEEEANNANNVNNANNGGENNNGEGNEQQSQVNKEGDKDKDKEVPK